MTFALKVFQKIQKKHALEFESEHQLAMKVGTHLDAAVLKLLKDQWTLDGHSQMKNMTGIFFSLWVENAGKNSGIVQYNIHALKLRYLGDHKIKAWDFAESFRKQVKREVKDWPSISFDYGPLTLLQGSFPLSEVSVENDCLDRLAAFMKVSPAIDALLAPHFVS